MTTPDSGTPDPVERIARALWDDVRSLMRFPTDYDSAPLALQGTYRSMARAVWPVVAELIDEARASMQQLQDRMAKHILKQDIEIKELRDKLTHHTGEQ